jgi:hypothetical protein
MKLFFRDFPALQPPLSAIIQQESSSSFVVPATKRRNVAAHFLVREIDQHIAHVKKTGLDWHW